MSDFDLVLSGRVILSDALAYACEQTPDLLIDFATLTGAARVALGADLPALFTRDLASPLRAVEAYQEYLSVAGENEAIRGQIYNIAQQLAAKQRYVEALAVFGVFVDSFPTDSRAPEALRAIGQIHQTNEAWKDALAAYQRILEEYKASPAIPQVKLAIAGCQINLSQWKAARKLYEEYLQAYPSDGQAALAKARIEILKTDNAVFMYVQQGYLIALYLKLVERVKNGVMFKFGGNYVLFPFSGAEDGCCN